MGMTYLLEECIAIAKFEGHAEWDEEVEVIDTPVGKTLTVEMPHDPSRSYHIASLTEVESHTNEEESRLIFGALEDEVTGDVAAALSEAICVTESTYRIVRRALDIVDGIYTQELSAEDAQAHAFVAAALLKNVVNPK